MQRAHGALEAVALRRKRREHVARHEHDAAVGDVEVLLSASRSLADDGAVRDAAALVDDRIRNVAAAADLDVGSTTERRTSLPSSTITPKNSSDSRTTAPETMQPPATIELIASPRRPSSSRMNFALGTCCW